MSAAYPRGPIPGQIDPKDESDLRTLIICTKAYAWLCILSVILCVGLGAALAYFTPAMKAEMSPSDSAELAFMIPMFFVGGAFCAGLTWLFFKSADCIKKRQSKTLIYVAAALACTNAPLGLALGIYTFVLLERPSIKLLFAA